MLSNPRLWFLSAVAIPYFLACSSEPAAPPHNAAPPAVVKPAEISAAPMPDAGGAPMPAPVDAAAPLAALKSELALKPDDITLHRKYQDILRSSGQATSLREEYANRLKTQPESALNHYLFGRSILLESPKEAEPEFRRAIQMDEKFVWAHLALGALQTNQGNHFDAIQTYEAALALFPDSSDLYLNLGNARNAIGATRTALEAAEKSISLSPQNAPGYELAGQVYSAQKNLPKAREYFEKALAIDPDLRNSNLHMADILSQSGDLDKARVYAAKAVSRGAVLSEGLKKRLTGSPQ